MTKLLKYVALHIVIHANLKSIMEFYCKQMKSNHNQKHGSLENVCHILSFKKIANHISLLAWLTVDQASCYNVTNYCMHVFQKSSFPRDVDASWYIVTIWYKWHAEMVLEAVKGVRFLLNMNIFIICKL